MTESIVLCRRVKDFCIDTYVDKISAKEKKTVSNQIDNRELKQNLADSALALLINQKQITMHWRDFLESLRIVMYTTLLPNRAN